jgi:hypothetical protein
MQASVLRGERCELRLPLRGSVRGVWTRPLRLIRASDRLLRRFVGLLKPRLLRKVVGQKGGMKMAGSRRRPARTSSGRTAATSMVSRPPKLCPIQPRARRRSRAGRPRAWRCPTARPTSSAVSAQVGGDDVEAAREPLLGELPEAQAVTGDAVQADDERRARVAPLVGVQLSELPRARSTCAP